MLKEYTIRSSQGNEDYSVILMFSDITKELVPDKCSCDCKFGSFYRFTQKNILMKKWMCEHMEQALVKLKRGELDNIEIAKKEEKNGKTKSICPIFN
jgi:hypothetical protein